MIRVKGYARSLDPSTYKVGWEIAQKEFEDFLKDQNKAKAKQALKQLKKGKPLDQIIEAA